jgi:hypothetical protein
MNAHVGERVDALLAETERAVTAMASRWRSGIDS